MKNIYLEKAIEEAGGVVKLGDMLGVSNPAVSRWRTTGKVPLRRAIMLQRLFGIPASKLCPTLKGVK